MRVWDIDPGFLNDGSLLAEHRELHALVRVCSHGVGPIDHPELRRWRPHMGGLAQRHRVLVEEMALRGYGHDSPVPRPEGQWTWPEGYLSEPLAQLEKIAERYRREHKPAGRIPLPKQATELWAAHKYSVMARDPELAREIGRQVADGELDMAACAVEMVEVLHRAPEPGRLRDALLHMWGYVSDREGADHESLSDRELLDQIRTRAREREVTYLIQSTALGELAAWM